MKLLLRFCGFVFAAGTIMFLVGVGARGLLWHFSKDLPDYSQLQDYEPPVMTRVHAGEARWWPNTPISGGSTFRFKPFRRW